MYNVRIQPEQSTSNVSQSQQPYARRPVNPHRTPSASFRADAPAGSPAILFIASIHLKVIAYRRRRPARLDSTGAAWCWVRGAGNRWLWTNTCHVPDDQTAWVRLVTSSECTDGQLATWGRPGSIVRTGRRRLSPRLPIYSKCDGQCGRAMNTAVTGQSTHRLLTVTIMNRTSIAWLRSSLLSALYQFWSSESFHSANLTLFLGSGNHSS